MNASVVKIGWAKLKGCGGCKSKQIFAINKTAMNSFTMFFY